MYWLVISFVVEKWRLYIKCDSINSYPKQMSSGHGIEMENVYTEGIFFPLTEIMAYPCVRERITNITRTTQI